MRRELGIAREAYRRYRTDDETDTIIAGLLVLLLVVPVALSYWGNDEDHRTRA